MLFHTHIICDLLLYLKLMPLIIPLTYYFLLPSPSSFLYATTPTVYNDLLSPPPPISALPYTPLPEAEDEEGEEEGTIPSGPKRGVALSIADKWRLVKPLIPKYMLPLCESITLLIH
jgi:battenin